MKKIYLMLGFLLACGSQKSCGKTVDAATSTDTNASTSSNDAGQSGVGGQFIPKEKVEWYPFSTVTYNRIKISNACSMFYFSAESGCSNCSAMESVLNDKGLVKLLNTKFVSTRYPVNVDTDKQRKEVLGVTELPGIILIGPVKDNKSFSSLLLGVTALSKLTEEINKSEYSQCEENKLKF